MLNRRASWPLRSLLGFVLLVGCAAPSPPPDPPPRAPAPGVKPAPQQRETQPPLAFCLQEGAGHNCLLSDDKTAAHVIATSGERPRLVVAFPAENSGIALFWRPAGEARTSALTLAEPPRSLVRDGQNGVRFVLKSDGPLQLERLLLGSVRTIRTYKQQRSLAALERLIDEATAALQRLPPAERQALAQKGLAPEALRRRLQVTLRPSHEQPHTLLAEGESLAGDGRFRLTLRAEALAYDPKSQTLGLPGQGLTLQVEALTSYPPLPRLALERLLRPEVREALQRSPALAERLQGALRSLSFLTGSTKYLAGSWRFLTYFGRDTLMSAWLLGPVLSPPALEAALQSVLDRLSPEGRVAHEESLGDQAVIERLEQFLATSRSQGQQAALAALAWPTAPVYDYKMVDDDFMLAPLLLAYLQHPQTSAAHAARFLGRQAQDGGSNAAALVRNLDFALQQAAPYASSGKTAELIRLRGQLEIGDWRDSLEGLGGGRYASSVNLYLVPAALEAIAALWRHPKLPRQALQQAAATCAGSPLADAKLLEQLDRLRAGWDKAAQPFAVKLTAAQLRQRLSRFLQSPQLSAAERRELPQRQLAPGLTLAQALAQGKLPGPLAGGLSYEALALTADGAPVEVMHSDDGLRLWASDLGPAELDRRLIKYELPYPVGLIGPFGLYVANPALSARATDYQLFDRSHYHGTVVWSWQQSMLQLGLLRQLARYRQLPGPQAAQLAARLTLVLDNLAAAEARVGPLKESELWTVQAGPQGLQPVAFGQLAGHTTESNALQLWSTVHLAVTWQRRLLGLDR